MPPNFTGNDIFLSQGQNVLPDGPVLARLLAGQFGPHPNDTAPPGFIIPPAAPSPIAEMLKVLPPATPPTPPARLVGQPFDSNGGIGTGGFGDFGALGSGFSPAFSDFAELGVALGDALGFGPGLGGFGFGAESGPGGFSGGDFGGDSEGGGFF